MPLSYFQNYLIIVLSSNIKGKKMNYDVIVNLNESEFEFIVKLYTKYYFGMFKQIGIAKNDTEEDYYRDQLDNIYKQAMDCVPG
jgi:hypothetical protein